KAPLGAFFMPTILLCNTPHPIVIYILADTFFQMYRLGIPPYIAYHQRRLRAVTQKLITIGMSDVCRFSPTSS
ncbi:MAG: hypothetical protein ACRCYD_07180, partial [Plesiomonas sp.]